MHDVGMNMSQLAMSVKQVDAAMAALHEAHDALEGYEEAIEADHNSVGSVKLV